MSKLKEKFINLAQILKKSLEKFPGTIIPILILTVIYAVNLDNNFISTKLLGKISFFILTFSSGAFVIETIKKDSFNQKIWYYIVSGVLAIFFTWKVVSNYSIYVNRWWITYIIATWIIGIYYSYKMSEKDFKEYVTKTFINIFKTSLIYGIFAIGFAIITAIFVYLILGGKGYTLILRIETLLFGIYYVPTIIYNLYEQKDEVGKFAKIVIKYVLGTLIMIAFSIIYMYIIKIIILAKIPSNQIFRILTALFVTGLPIWTMVSYFDENSLFDKVNNKLPLLFIPFIFLQMYAIGARIFANGITIPRYLCIMVIVFEIIYTFVYIKNKENIGKMLWVFILLTIISINVPYVNMYSISNKSQQGILRAYTKKENQTDKEITKAYEAYKYLKNSDYGKGYISKEDENFIKKIEDERKDLIDGKDSVSTIRLYASKSLDVINVDGYKTLYEVSTENYDENNTIDKVMSNVEFNAKGKRICTLNILSKVNEYLAHENNLDDYFEKENEITVDNNRKLILTYFHISYNKFTNEVDYYNITGYLLEK